eukprot:gnl/Spiro4/16936_TR9134_c0_g1_i1.p1 gnl/Spiro4/16936_TR9134_c0_g1~~gnl/Spiro4/16936_TR9134_c0_g1_i1.p1  ORF type:complete len:203 (-),score=26.93 gnl/Spiro4/16936_TR9134_c0_g1_i1:65-616(-)
MATTFAALLPAHAQAQLYDSLDQFLLSRTFLDGERISFNDISLAFQIDANHVSAAHTNLKRWLDTIRNQELFHKLASGGASSGKNKSKKANRAQALRPDPQAVDEACAWVSRFGPALANCCESIDQYLLSRTFLSTERLSFSDVCMQKVVEYCSRVAHVPVSHLTNLSRWMDTVHNSQPHHGH